MRPRAATLDGSSVGALPETLSKLVAAMAGLPDDKYRYKQLLFWAAEAPDLAATRPRKWAAYVANAVQDDKARLLE